MKRGTLRSPPPPGAFTLPELLVVIGGIALLAGLLLPALNRAQARAQGTVCANQLRQLQIGGQMYVDDHQGRMPENLAGLFAGGWRSSTNSWTGPSSASRDPDDAMIRQGSLVRLGYLPSPAVFRCPTDDALVRDRSGRDLDLPRSRSCSMNGSFGGRETEAQVVYDRENLDYNPSKVFLSIDEHEDSIDDGHFLVWPVPDDRWVNLPADRHDGSGVLSFVDGHLERWKWPEPKQLRAGSAWAPVPRRTNLPQSGAASRIAALPFGPALLRRDHWNGDLTVAPLVRGRIRRPPGRPRRNSSPWSRTMAGSWTPSY